VPVLALIAFALPASAQYTVKAGGAYTVTLPDIIASSDHLSGLTAQTGTVYLTRVTGSSGAVTKAASTNNISEIDSVNAPGQYKLTLTATELGAIGWIKGYYKAASSDPVSFTVRVVAYDPDDASLLGLSGVATAAAQTSAATNLTGIKAKTDLLATNAADSPNEVTAQGNASTAATQASAANTKLGTPVASIAADIAALPTASANATAIWAAAVRQLTGTQSFNLTGNITGSLSGSVNSVSSAVTVGTNNDKTGYSLTQAFPPNFPLLDIEAITGKVKITAGEHTAIQTDAATGIMASSFITVPGTSTTSGTQVVLTYKQWMALQDALAGGDTVSTSPVANSTFTVTYYLRGASHTSGNIVSVSTVTLDASKNQTGRTVKVKEPFPSIP